ncbi:ABC transporter substrate-binding protein [Volucribacter amazonae]|uniref:Iron(III) transport system substrate-binding protein n=1 Tax=Volucribacter amazonae TaxID=256731 RepID=A0A9X4PBH4_9PAST|nr:ABC transporter substrate-binding protein [Volucribacter amazonae]MDG6894496.1 hypothetical protein [Volucribacter amazonae]
MKNTIKPLVTALALASSLLFTSNLAIAKGKLTVYCTLQQEACEKLLKTFSEKYQIDSKFIRNGTGAILSRIKAEQNNPQADVWLGGTIEPHLQAADLGLLEAYRSPLQTQIMPQFNTLMAQYGDYTSVMYMLILAMGINTEKMAKLGIEQNQYPQCWRDLLDPKLKGEVLLPDPQVSGTSYNFIATLIQLWGEEQAFDYLKQLNNNIPYYGKSGMVTNSLARGETAIAIGYLHDYQIEKDKGAPIVSVLPCEGDGYALGGLSIIKSARNLDNAKLFVDWALDVEAQELPWREAGAYQIPANINAKVSPNSIDPSKLQLIDFDFNKFGSSEEGQRIVKKWLEEVKQAN